MSEDNTLTGHLEALRAVLIKSLCALAVCLLPVFFAAPYVLDLLISIITRGEDVTLNFFSPLEVFILQIKTALLLDAVICFPYIAYQVWGFVLPALYDNERRFIRSVVPLSGFLFAAGVFLCLFMIMPMVIRFGLSFAADGIKAVLGLNNVVSLALRLSFVFGLMFQFPLVTVALMRGGIMSYEDIKRKRPYVFVFILVLAGLLTPPDIVSQLMLAVPTYALFEAGLFFGRKKSS